MNQPTPINRDQLIALIIPALQALEQLMAALERKPEERKTAVPEGEWTPPEPIRDQGPACPKCQGPMKKRNGSRGEFWGCQSYPHCDGTRQPKPNDDIRRAMGKQSSYRGAMTFQSGGHR